MEELFTKLLASLGAGSKKMARAVATGNTQQQLGIQSPHTAGAVVRVGRFLYTTTLGWIFLSWYTGFVNERTAPGDGPKILLGGKIVSTPDRPNVGVSDVVSALSHPPQNKAQRRQLQQALQGEGQSPSNARSEANQAGQGGAPLIAIAPSQLGVPGSALPGYLWTVPNDQKQLPAYNAQRTAGLQNFAVAIASHFGLTVSSGYRPGSAGAGGTPDLHSVGLAFDLVGSTVNMKRAATWAHSVGGQAFQEIFIHNEGSGLHLHLGFQPDTLTVLRQNWPNRGAVFSNPGAAN